MLLSLASVEAVMTVIVTVCVLMFSVVVLKVEVVVFVKPQVTGFRLALLSKMNWPLLLPYPLSSPVGS